MRKYELKPGTTIWDDPMDLDNFKRDSAAIETEAARERAMKKLIATLKSAYSGELGAISAYRGHRKSVCDWEDKKGIHQIEMEEMSHRERVGEMLILLGEVPSVSRETVMGWVGTALGYLCSWSGWFAPMYGAGLLESQNIKEYQDAARFALAAGHVEFLDDLLTMAEVEWEHEKFFRERCQSHFLYHWFPKWTVPPARGTLRAPFEKIEYPEGQLAYHWNAECLAR